MSVPKTPIPPQDVVATRELKVEGSLDRVVVQLGRPYHVTDTEAVCAFRIAYRDVTHGWDVHGVDTFQALELALRLLPTHLRHAASIPVEKTYLDKPGDDMGFPEVMQ